MSLRKSKAVIFDVEGTLIECVPQIIESWRQTLSEEGHEFTTAKLQRYSGMDGADMLKILLPDLPSGKIQQLLQAQGERYRQQFIQTTRPFPWVREVFAALRREGYQLAIATTCHNDELTVYDDMMHVLDRAYAVICGDDVKHGKPHSDLFLRALTKLRQRRASCAFAVGDTPYDAKGAVPLGIQPIGVLTGGFSRGDLETAGCRPVLREVSDLINYLQTSPSQRVGS